MPEILCPDCGKRMFHENEDTLKVENTIHQKFCRKKEGASHSYMHRARNEKEPIDVERNSDENGKPILKR